MNEPLVGFLAGGEVGLGLIYSRSAVEPFLVLNDFDQADEFANRLEGSLGLTPFAPPESICTKARLLWGKLSLQV